MNNIKHSIDQFKNFILHPKTAIRTKLLSKRLSQNNVITLHALQEKNKINISGNANKTISLQLEDLQTLVKKFPEKFETLIKNFNSFTIEQLQKLISEFKLTKKEKAFFKALDSVNQNQKQDKLANILNLIKSDKDIDKSLINKVIDASGSGLNHQNQAIMTKILYQLICKKGFDLNASNIAKVFDFVIYKSGDKDFSKPKAQLLYEISKTLCSEKFNSQLTADQSLRLDLFQRAYDLYKDHVDLFENLSTSSIR